MYFLSCFGTLFYTNPTNSFVWLNCIHCSGFNLYVTMSNSSLTQTWHRCIATYSHCTRGFLCHRLQPSGRHHCNFSTLHLYLCIQGFSSSALLMFWTISVCACEGCFALQNVTSWSHSLDPSGIASVKTPKLFPGIATCLLRGKNLPQMRSTVV